VQTEPGKILKDSRDMLFANATRIDILDAQQKAAAASAREVASADRRKGMTEMETAGGTRREAGSHARDHVTP
jgi:hypothetical protein